MLNLYTPPAELPIKNYHELTDATQYDLNFIVALPGDLVSEGIVLTPCIPSLHARFLHEELSPAIETPLYKYLPYVDSIPLPSLLSYGPFTDFPSFLTFLESKRLDPGTLLFVAYDQSLVFENPLATPELESKRPERIAGLLGMLNTSQINRQSEIGNVHILPKFQKSHVTTHSVGLLLQWMFEAERVRRVCWYANSLNLPSVDAAIRLGYLYEGDLRWDRVLPSNKAGIELSPAQIEQEEKAGYGLTGRHSSVLSIGFDDWEVPRNGNEPVKERIAKLMSREVKKRNYV